jgi:hypothetical protein
VVTIRTTNELILSLIEFFRANQPELDTKPGAVARDLFIEAPSTSLSLLYDELAKISDLQSLKLASGANLDNLALNFGESRKGPKNSSGIALFTFSSLPASIAISKGGVVTAKNGATFAVSSGTLINPSFANLYRAIATRYRTDLDFLGITDVYAVEIPVVATQAGSNGDISKYALNRVGIPGVSSVTNIIPFSGGVDQEDDASFRNRVLAIFSGSNVGTSLGYRSIVSIDPRVTDALVIEPGDSLMQRDGTVVTKNTLDGTYKIITEGQGGKVDVIILGQNLSEFVDSFVYRDASNSNDPTNSKNDFVLGQIQGDENKTINRKRIDNLATGVLPAQPVDSILQVTGTLSGSNFKPKSIDSLGRVTGNYELVKDANVYAGSPWGFDKFKWISDRISDLPEDKIKQKANSQDALSFSGVISIDSVRQNVSIQSENSGVYTPSNIAVDYSLIKLLHTPCTNVTRVLNASTGERYTVVSQNPNGGVSNTSGIIKISGNTLPNISDVLQVDYEWIVDYDQYVDFDGKVHTTNPRSTGDSVDWGFANAVRKERCTFSNANAIISGTLTHPINSLVVVNVAAETATTLTFPLTGTFKNRFVAVLTNLTDPVVSVSTVRLTNTAKDLYNTAQNNSYFTNTKSIVSGLIKYTCTIVLPEDTDASVGQNVIVNYNGADIFTVNGVSGNFNSNSITIPTKNYSTAPSSFVAEVSYIADLQDLITFNLRETPLVRRGNTMVSGSQFAINHPNSSYIVQREYSTVASGSPSTISTTVNLLSRSLTVDSIVAVVRVSDGLNLWIAPGTITADVNNNAVLNLNSATVVTNGDNVIIFHTAQPRLQFEPLTFKNEISYFTSLQVLADSVTGKPYVDLSSLPANIDVNQISIVRLSDSMEFIGSGSITSSKFYFTDASATAFNVITNQRMVVIAFTPTALRSAPTRLIATLTDQTNNTGTLMVSGTTSTKVTALVQSFNSGLTQDLFTAFVSTLGIAGNIPSNYFLARLVSLEKVEVLSGEVVSVLATYDTFQSKVLNENLFSLDHIADNTLSNTSFTLPSTPNNVANAPAITDMLRATFYIGNSADTEDFFFTKNGVVYGNKSFAILDKVAIASGFADVSSGRITLTSSNQPITNSRYTAVYNYTAPKQNERIIVSYNYNRLIADSAITLEQSRPINADVLPKAAFKKFIELTMYVVVKPEYANSADIIVQNVQARVISSINTNKLGTTLDASDLSTVAATVDGVDRVRIERFNSDGKLGQVLSIVCQRNEYFSADEIVVILEGR